jgi:hypothetical protein
MISCQNRPANKSTVNIPAFHRDELIRVDRPTPVTGIYYRMNRSIVVSGSAELVRIDWLQWGETMRSACLILLILASGCASTDSSFVVSAKSTKTRLSFIDDAKGVSDSSADLKLTATEKDAEAKVAAACDSPNKAIALAAAGLAIDRGIDFVIGRIDKVLQAEIGKYTAVYEAAESLSFYRVSSAAPRLAPNCLRLTRLKNDTQDVAMDFVARLDIDGGERLRITPLRLYVAHPAVETSNGNSGISATLRIDASWREENRAEKLSEVVNVALFAAKIERNTQKPFYNVICTWAPNQPQPCTEALLAPLPPWSRYGSVDFGGNLVIATVTVAEAGQVGWLLDTLAKGFSDNKDNVGKELKSAAKKAAGIE